MGWSDAIGDSLTIPGDAVPGDGRDTIVLGENLPPELEPYLDTAILLNNGGYVEDAPGDMQQLKYFGMGSKDNYYVMFLYIVNSGNTPGDDRFIQLQSYTYQNTGLPPNGYNLFSFLGPYSEDSPTANLEYGTQAVAGGALQNLTYLGPFYVGNVYLTSRFQNWDAPTTGHDRLILQLGPDGWCHLDGLVRVTSAISRTGIGTGIDIFSLPAVLRPAYMHAFNALANNNRQVRIDVLPTGQVRLMPGSQSIPINAFIPFRFQWKTSQLVTLSKPGN